MKQKSGWILPSLFFIAMLLSCGERQHELRFHFKEGQKLRYVISMQSEAKVSDSLGQRPLNSSVDIWFSETVERIYPNGEARVGLTVDSLQYQTDIFSSADAENVSRNLKALRPKIKLSPFGDLQETEGLNDLPSVDFGGVDLFRMLAKVYPVLPHSPVAAGDEWDRQQEMPVESSLSRGTLYLQKHFRLAGFEDRKGSPCAKLSLTARANLGIKEGSPFQVSSHEGWIGKGEGILYFDLGQGIFTEGRADLILGMKTSIKDPKTGKISEHPVEIAETVRLSLLGVQP